MQAAGLWGQPAQQHGRHLCHLYRAPNVLNMRIFLLHTTKQFGRNDIIGQHFTPTVNLCRREDRTLSQAAHGYDQTC